MNQPAVLHRGPVATVHAAWMAGKPMAWKVFPAKFDRRTLAAVQHDRSRLSALSAPILPVDGVERWDGRHALRMELCAESLAARIRRAGPLPVADVVALGYSLARALAAAHRCGVLHGAVNPDNVVYRTADQPLLADFGVALREAFPRDPLHAIEYVSPETLRTSRVTEHSDLYGLGAVLHIALTGRSPHPGRLGEQPGERVLRVLGSPPPVISRPDVPVALATVIARLLAGAVTNRPPDAAWVVARLADMLPQRPDGDTEQLPASLPANRPRGRRLVAGAITLLILLAVVLVLGLGAKPSGDTAMAGTGVAGPATPSATLITADIELAPPQDFGDYVVLTWTSQRTLDFVVIIESDGQPDDSRLVQRNHTTTLPVDRAGSYCFLIRGTDGNQAYESRPAAIRGATCHE